jgi:uncharacterized protein
MLEIWVGLAGGILIGATGAGAGLLVTPLLILLGYPPTVAIATGLGALVASKFVGTVTHHQLGHWPGRGAWTLVAGGAGGVAVAWWLLHAWVAGGGGGGADFWLKRALGAMLLAAAGGLLLGERVWRNGGSSVSEKNPALLFVLGAGAAVPVTLTSGGSGTLLVPTLALVTNWSVPQLAAASNVFGWAVGALSVITTARFGFFNWPLFAKVLVGILPGVAVGALLSRRIPRSWFVRSLVLVSVYLAARLLLG